MATATKKSSKKRQTKAGAIRNYLHQHSDAGPTAVSAALKKQGIVVAPAHVSNVKADMKKKAGGASGANGTISSKAGGRGRRGPKPRAADAVSLADLLAARRFAEQVGGVAAATNLLESLAKLQ